MPADGGPHPGGGTCNALVSFGEGCYLEIIAPDPQQDIAGTNGQRFAALSKPELLHWAVRSGDLAGLSARFTASGLTPGAVRDMARVAPGGEQLQWQLMGITGHELGGLMPFFIDWQDTPHPSVAAPLVGKLKALELGLPQAQTQNRRGPSGFLAELVAELIEVRPEPGLAIAFDSPAGTQTYEAVNPHGFGFK